MVPREAVHRQNALWERFEENPLLSEFTLSLPKGLLSSGLLRQPALSLEFILSLEFTLNLLKGREVSKGEIWP